MRGYEAIAEKLDDLQQVIARRGASKYVTQEYMDTILPIVIKLRHLTELEISKTQTTKKNSKGIQGKS